MFTVTKPRECTLNRVSLHYYLAYTAADYNVGGSIHRVYCIYTLVYTYMSSLLCQRTFPVDASRRFIQFLQIDDNKRCVKTASQQAIYSLPSYN